MRMQRVLGVLAASAVVCAAVAYAQDSQSLGEAARQARLQKQLKEAQPKDTPTKDAQPSKPPRVITNDEIPEHVGSTLTPATSSQTPSTAYTPPSYKTRESPAAQWKNQIQAQKNAIASLQRQIASLTESIHYPENCLADCAQRNERQREKEQQLESLMAQLEQQQKWLEDLQEAARKQGFGSSVYDP